jgi:ABC-type sugar transport system permease subunit
MYQRSRRVLVIPFLLPTFVIYTFFVFVPLALTIYYGFTNWQGHTLSRPWYGLGNFRLILLDNQVVGAFLNTFKFAIFGALIIFIPALFLSWALSQKIKGKSFFRFIIIAPLVLSVIVVGLLWKLLYNPVFGPINNLLNLVGLDQLALPWLGDSRTVILAIVIATAWQQLGMWVLLISAGMNRIPSELLDAARVDGASEWQVYWKITFPLLWGILRLLFILWIIMSLQVFAQIWIMVPHGGGGGAEVVATLIYTRAFSSQQWGLAAALATILLILIFSASLVTNRLTRREKIEF